MKVYVKDIYYTLNVIKQTDKNIVIKGKKNYFVICHIF